MAHNNDDADEQVFKNKGGGGCGPHQRSQTLDMWGMQIAQYESHSHQQTLKDNLQYMSVQEQPRAQRSARE